MNQFPGQHLSFGGNTIFCTACKEVVSSKESILQSHCASKKHASGKEKIKKSKLREQTITETLSREKSHLDSTLPLAEGAYRCQEGATGSAIFCCFRESF